MSNAFTSIALDIREVWLAVTVWVRDRALGFVGACKSTGKTRTITRRLPRTITPFVAWVEIAITTTVTITATVPFVITLAC
jgi:hypothetical protein